MTSPDDRLAAPPDLGPKQAEFRASGWGRLGLGCLGLICALIGVAFMAAIIVGLVNGRSEGFRGLLVFGCLFLLGGVALLRAIRSAARTRIEICADGLILWEGAASLPCRWTEIVAVTEKEAVNAEEVVQEGLIHESRAFRLTLRSGQVIALKSYLSGLAKLGAILKRETLPHLLPGYQAAVDRGRRVEFGPICLHRDGIEVHEDLLPWPEVAGVDRKGGWIRVHARGAWTSWKKVKLSEVPNAHVLLDLVAQRSRENSFD
jgi:hypothetical protein